MRNKNIWIGIGLVAAIALVAVLAMVLPTRIALSGIGRTCAGAGCHHRLCRHGRTPPPKLPPTAESPTQPAETAEPTIEPTATAEPTAEAHRHHSACQYG